MGKTLQKVSFFEDSRFQTVHLNSRLHTGVITGGGGGGLGDYNQDFTVYHA